MLCEEKKINPPFMAKDPNATQKKNHLMNPVNPKEVGKNSNTKPGHGLLLE